MSIKTQQDKLQSAALSMAAEYAAEADQHPAGVTGCHPILNTPLDQVLRDALYNGALDAVMSAVRGNQTKAAQMLGINRSTLRKRLKRYGFMDDSQTLSGPSWVKDNAERQEIA